MSTPADDHRTVAADFTARVEGVAADGWNAPSPVEGWLARDVVAHLITWLPAVLGTDLGPIHPVADDPVRAWHDHCAAVQAVLDDPEASRREVSNPHFPAMPAEQVIAMMYTPDVFMHTWDLARATGQDDSLDPERCEALLAGVRTMAEPMRSSGQYGPEVPVADDASAQDRLIGFIGRDPAWRPPT